LRLVPVLLLAIAFGADQRTFAGDQSGADPMIERCRREIAAISAILNLN